MSDQIAQDIAALCPLRNNIRVVVCPERGVNWWIDVYSNCRCGWNNSHLQIPARELRNAHQDDPAQYAALSLRNCRPPMVGMNCKHREPE